VEDYRIRAVGDWLIDGARSAASSQQVLAELCERLVACGIPLWRVAVFVRTLHPNVMGRRFVRRPGAEVQISEAPFEVLESTDFRDSPVARVYETGRAVRRKLADPNCAADFALLSQLRDEGVTDYLATPLVFTNGELHVATWTTQQPGGFTAAQIAGIKAIAAPLARVTEIWALR
jgi:adenylate cyclase